MPLFFWKDGIQIVVTPLNILRAQNEAELAKANIHAVAVHAGTATPRPFRVSDAPTSQNIQNTYHQQDIEEGRYRAVAVNPEELMEDGSGFERLWKVNSFTSRIISMIWDEAHTLAYGP